MDESKYFEPLLWRGHINNGPGLPFDVNSGHVARPADLHLFVSPFIVPSPSCAIHQRMGHDFSSNNRNWELSSRVSGKRGKSGLFAMSGSTDLTRADWRSAGTGRREKIAWSFQIQEFWSFHPEFDVNLSVIWSLNGPMKTGKFPKILNGIGPARACVCFWSVDNPDDDEGCLHLTKRLDLHATFICSVGKGNRGEDFLLCGFCRIRGFDMYGNMKPQMSTCVIHAVYKQNFPFRWS